MSKKKDDLDMLLLQRYTTEWVWLVVTVVLMCAIVALVSWTWWGV